MRDIILGLSLTPKVGWKTIEQILLIINEQKLVNILNKNAKEWMEQFSFLSRDQAMELSKNMTNTQIEEAKYRLKRDDIKFCTIIDEQYPAMLKEIYSAPWILFLKGDISLLEIPLLAVVGARKISAYGKAVVHSLIPPLVKHGWGIVSGLALGVDAKSHQESLKAGGKTIAVLGSGIDQVYPPSHRKLYNEIVELGLIISEYPPLTAPHPAYFPQRNRIISGISQGVVVIEAAKKSGSLITAHAALDQGREVFAIPGSIFSPASVGTNLLIQQGAKMVTNTEDILEEFPYLKEKEEEICNYQGVNKGNVVDDIEKEILDLFSEEKLEINQLLLLTNYSFATLSTYLLKLEMKGFIQKLPGNYYQLLKEIDNK